MLMQAATGTPLLRIHALAALVHPCTSSTFASSIQKRGKPSNRLKRQLRRAK